jgi:hypothetical protein
MWTILRGLQGQSGELVSKPIKRLIVRATDEGAKGE